MNLMKNNTHKRIQTSVLAAAIATCLYTVPVMAESDTYGEVRGVVVSAGMDIANAEISLKHETKGISRTVSSNNDGEFSVKGLPVGSYTISIVKDGYQTLLVKEVSVSLGQTADLGDVALADTGTEIIEISGSAIAKIDIESSQQGVHFSAGELATMAVGENLSDVATLAPGNSLGDSDIFSGIGGSDGRLVSSAGGSIAENGYYLNGFNITDIRYNAIISDFPWEIVEQINVINGGIPARYGRTVGGVTNMVSKSGDNEFRFGGKVDWSPGSMGATKPDFNFTNDKGEGWENHDRHSEDYADKKEYSLYASGPLIEDKAFFYVLYAPSVDKYEFAGAGSGNTTLTEREVEKDSLFVNLDWQVSENHSLNLIYMDSQKDTTDFNYNWSAAEGRGDLTVDLAGLDRTYSTDNTLTILGYNGYITDELSLSASYGKMETVNDIALGTPGQSRLRDCRTGTCVTVSNTVGSSVTAENDSRDSYRIDFDWALTDDHSLSFGYEQDDINAKTDIHGHGSDDLDEFDLSKHYVNQDVYTSTSDRTRWCDFGNACVNGSFTLPAGDYLYTRQFDKISDIDAKFSAYYLQDKWQVSDQLVATVGVRNEKFSNTTNNGDKWIDIDNQWAPRVELNYDLTGDGSQKVFFNYGRYYQPLALRVSERFVSPEIDIRTFRLAELDGGNLTAGPIQGVQVSGDGNVRPGQIYAAADLKPMYLDGYNLGYEIALEDNWLLGLNFTYRDLARSIEDSQVDGFAGEGGWGVLQWCADTQKDCTGFEDIAGQNWNGGSARLINPGQDLTIWEDFNGDGELSKETIPAEYLRYPKAIRKYKAITFSFDGDVTEQFHIAGSYTWSRSEGNTEGLVRSDNGQRDPGWTRAFDEPEIVEDGYGRLPNDRPHNFKLWGSYELTEDLTASFNYNWYSGRPINYFGYHENLPGWGAEYFRHDEQPVPRGTAGRTANTQTLNLGLNYFTEIMGGQTQFSLTVFNPFNWHTVVDVYEIGERSSLQDLAAGEPLTANDNALWNTPTNWQAPRSVQLSVRYDF